jgi:hypothetical protein
VVPASGSPRFKDACQPLLAVAIPRANAARHLGSELNILHKNCATIRIELDAVLAEKQAIPRYHEITARETFISGTIDADKGWRVFMLYSPFGTPRKNQAKCP